MPKRAKELGALQVKRLATKAGFHAVGGVAGLYLVVGEAGACSWILYITVGKKRPQIGLGSYPSVTLEKAREVARTMHAQRMEGIDPLAAKRSAQDVLANRLTFDEVAAAWHRLVSPSLRSPKHIAQLKSTLDTYASPIIGTVPIDQIERAHVVRVLEPVWTTKTETATRVRQRVEAVLAYATANGMRSGENPARWDGNLEYALPAPQRKVKHLAALAWPEVGAFMLQLRQQAGTGARALEFAILTAARSGEARLSVWSEIDIPRRVWRVPAERMKANKSHSVPLSDRAVELLQALPRTDSQFVFAPAKGGPLSDMTLSAVLRRMAVDVTVHGFRSSFKDWARSSTAYPDEVSEIALAHVSTDATRAAYARDELLPQRARLMQDWARFCGTVPRAAAVSPIGKRR